MLAQGIISTTLLWSLKPDCVCKNLFLEYLIVSTPRCVSGTLLLVCHENSVLGNTAIDICIF